MATKRTKTKGMRKPVSKNPKTSNRKTPLKGKPKSPKKSAPAPKKRVAKQITPVKAKAKAAKKTKSIAPKRTAPKIAPVKKQTKSPPKNKIGIKKPHVRKKSAGITSEETRKAELRKTLIAKRETIVQEARTEISKYIKGETRQLVDTALDDGDWSVVDLSEDISLKQLSSHGENLRKIDEALRKLNEDTYGMCEDCGEKIEEGRLKILPFAIYCIDCQERKEQFEEMERMER
jgi:DnaK suppressor protein